MNSVEDLGRAANKDHYLRWRLRNIRVDRVDVDELVRVWHSGGSAPDVRGLLVPAPRRALESSARLDLIHGTLRGDPPPRPGGRATAGDVAFVRGDHGTAERAYLERVLLEPQDDAAWAGLALVADRGAGPGLIKPEVVKAVAVRLAADPIAVARWIRAG